MMTSQARVVSGAERVTLVVLIAAAAVLRILAFFRYRFDSDEPQHMHVAWGWANGFVQYRDIFDNHMPLFHLLTAPLFLGGVDDARLLFAARLLMTPLFVMAIALVWIIASRLFDATTAAWSAVFAADAPALPRATLSAAVRAALDEAPASPRGNGSFAGAAAVFHESGPAETVLWIFAPPERPTAASSSCCSSSRSASSWSAPTASPSM